MTHTPVTHVIDTNVFIQAHRQYYPFDICPGFWDCLLYSAQTNRIVSIDRVQDEMKAGNDSLKTWATKTVPKSFFAPTSSDAAVFAQFSAMMQWVQAQAQFKPEAKAEFARVADGWVAAYAKVHSLTLVTQEEYAAESRKKVPLPNVCRAFNVPYANTYDMLRALGVRFVWTPPQVNA
jgi:Domain of unknown function (DUF4411)